MLLEVKKEEKLIKFLIHNIQGLSFGQAQKLMRLGKIKVNLKKTKENIILKCGDNVEIFYQNSNIPDIKILYKDDNILIVHKPFGMECAKRDKSSENTISLEEVLCDYNGIIVHRLDRLTEGLVIVARSIDIARKFEKYFQDKQINKYYKALVYNHVQEQGTFHAYLKKDANKSKVVISDRKKEGYKEIITEYSIVDHINDYTLLDIILHTGRTHQIRAHLSHLGHPVVNDTKYATRPTLPQYKGYFLTAYKLTFNIQDELQYLNDITIEITPTWIDKII